MISDKTRANRLRRYRKLKRLYEVKLEDAVSDHDKNHVKTRIAEIDRDIVATKGDSIEEGDAPPILEAKKEYVEARLAEREKVEGVMLPEPKALLDVITKTAKDDVKKSEEPPKRLRKKKVGNPF